METSPAGIAAQARQASRGPILESAALPAQHYRQGPRVATSKAAGKTRPAEALSQR